MTIKYESVELALPEEEMAGAKKLLDKFIPLLNRSFKKNREDGYFEIEYHTKEDFQGRPTTIHIEIRHWKELEEQRT